MESGWPAPARVKLMAYAMSVDRRPAPCRWFT